MMVILTEKEKAHGVIPVPAGNHSRGVSYVAKVLGINAVIFPLERIPSNEVAAIKRLGAEVVVHGKGYDEATENASHLQREREFTLIHCCNCYWQCRSFPAFEGSYYLQDTGR